MISKECEKCVFYDTSDEELPCNMKGTTIKCSTLKEYAERLKFKKEVKL